MVGDWVFYCKPQTHKLDPFRWRGPALVIAVECTTDRATTIYWVVHGSSLVRTTRQQLRHETVPERYERQAKPGAENDLKRPLADRILAALRPVRGPVRGLDLAARAQTPDDFPSLGGRSSINTLDGTASATAVPPHEPARPPTASAAATAMEAEPTETTTTPARASTDNDKTDLDQLAKKHLPAPVKGKDKSFAKFPAHKREKTSPSGLRAEPPGETEESTRFADQPMDFEVTAEQAEIRDRLTQIHPGIMESHNAIAENNQEPTEDDADRARERRHLEQAIRTASRISEDRNRRLDGIPRRQAVQLVLEKFNISDQSFVSRLIPLSRRSDITESWLCHLHDFMLLQANHLGKKPSHVS